MTSKWLNGIGRWQILLEMETHLATFLNSGLTAAYELATVQTRVHKDSERMSLRRTRYQFNRAEFKSSSQSLKDLRLV